MNKDTARDKDTTQGPETGITGEAASAGEAAVNKESTGDREALRRDEAERLQQRLQEVERRERALIARERLAGQGLPGELAEHLDLSSAEALERGLKLVEQMKRLRGLQAEAPKAHREGGAELPRGYRERAALYQSDPWGYKALLGQDG